MPKLTRRTTLAGAAALLATHRAQAATTLEFTTWQAEEPGFGAWWKELIAAFEQKNRGTQIKVTGIPYKDYLDQLTIRFASNRPPPLFELNTDTVGAFASQDWLQPLDDRIKQSVIGTDKWSGPAAGFELGRQDAGRAADGLRLHAVLQSGAARPGRGDAAG